MCRKVQSIIFAVFALWVFAPVVSAQSLIKVAENEQYTDYHFVNDSLRPVHAYEFTVQAGDAGALSVFSQTVREVEWHTSTPELATALALFGDDIPLFERVEGGISRGRQIDNLRFHPTRYSESDSRTLLIVKEARFRVRHAPNDAPHRTTAAALTNETSPFQTGQWYKIPISERGIYQIDRAYLESIGLSPAAINPSQVQIWTTPGGELPRLNAAERPQLQQIPILFEGNTSNSFDQGDRLFFYADSPHAEFREQNGSFSHQLHRYSNENHVFLTVANEPGLRAAPQPFLDAPNRISQVRDVFWYEEDLFKSEPKIRSGLNWYAVQLSNNPGNQSRDVVTATIPGLIPNQTVNVDLRLVGRSTQTMQMSFFLNGQSIATSTVGSIRSYSSEEGISGRALTVGTSTQIGSTEELTLRAQLNAPEPNSEGFVDWVRFTFDRSLTAHNNELLFFAPEGLSGRAVYEMDGFGSTPMVFEVSDAQTPRPLQAQQIQGRYQFSFDHSQPEHRFYAQSDIRVPAEATPVDNQNLRGISSFPQYIIVTAPLFYDQALEWAAYREQKDGFTTVVALQEEIFNEFNGGTPDVTAIRDYVKFLYDRAFAAGQTPPEHLLLFGDATFDFRNITGGSITNHVFTFQSEESLHRINSYGSDDFFVLLDDSEGEWQPFTSQERIDMGVGRFPVNTRQEAAILMDKIRRYENSDTQGDWRTRFTFAADDDFPEVELNRDLHLLNADGTAIEIDYESSATIANKIYMLSYPVETTAAGRRVPGATDDLIAAFNNGSLVVNYSGHGNETILADEFLFSADMIPRLTNRDRPAIFVTATCQFGRYDDADAKSGAEQTLLWEDGGIVAALTTTRVVFTSASPGSNNFGLNIQLTRQMVQPTSDGKPQRLGDIYRNTKNTSQGAGFNARKFILLGDPAMRIGLPDQQAEITSINDVDLAANPDTVLQIRALDRMVIDGAIRNQTGGIDTQFNGEATVRVLDSERVVNLPSKQWVQEGRCFLPNCQYSVENDVLFNGLVSVQNGLFRSEFIVPRDISFSEERGRILVYASSQQTDASASVTNFFLNGVNENAPTDRQGPELDVYLNDRTFVNGNLVGSNSILFVDLEDESGINTTGIGVGHEIIATIDTNPRQTVVLNDFYRSDLDDFRKGRIEYPLEELPTGSYTLTVRAWDVQNNPSEQEIQFEVADSDQLEIRNVYNYPNPMNNRTRFIFEHNQPGNLLDIDIRIFTLSGMPVTRLRETQITSNAYADIEWNGLDRDHDRLANGTYIYVLRVRADTPQGMQTQEKIEKLVIIR
ncbi:MAG: type IX secretion system sortase PorU [Balneolaceae bacterium]